MLGSMLSSSMMFVLAPGVVEIDLNRPDKANALNAELVENLHACFDHAENDAGIRAAVIGAQGKTFSGGFDFEGYQALTEAEILLRFVRIEQLLHRIRQAKFLTIARVQGAAFGAGADIAASCDYRVGTEAARFRFPGFRFGVALGTSRLASIAGQRNAQDMLLESQVVGAKQAMDCGLLTHLVSEAELDETTGRLARSASAFDAPSLQAMLSRVRVPPSNGDAELAALVRSVVRPGIKDRIKSFLAARQRPLSETGRETG